MDSNVVAWISRAIIFGSVIMYGSIGETITEKSGNLNLGTPGIMCIGGSLGFAAAYKYEISSSNPNMIICILVSFIAGFMASALVGLLYSFLTTSLLANQNVTGLTITIFGVGLAKFVGLYVIPEGAVSTKATFVNSVFAKNIFYIGKLGTFSDVFLSYGFMMYLAIVIAVITSLIINKTRVGLNLRAVGENAATADAAGINVKKYKYLATCIGSGITGLGGIYYVLDYNYGTWATAAADSIESLAWLSVALVIFATWKPVNIIWGSYIFGLCYWAYNYLPIVLGITVSTYIAQMLPYIVTILVLIICSLKKSRENQAPQSLGVTYFREER